MKTLLAFLLLTASAIAAEPAKPSAAPIPPVPEQQLTIKLPLSSWNIIISGLQEVPFKYSSAIITAIQLQAQPQLAPPKSDDKPKK